MRERTTWNRNDILKRAAINKKADPYTMNQDHKNPPADKYVNGDPSSWAEDVHSPNEWEKEYANGQTKRNEIGMPEMRSETFNHAEKTASEQLLVKKADLCVKVARAMLKKASEEVVEDQAVALMSLGDSELIDTFNRLAQDQDGQQAQAEEPKQAQDQQDQNQAPAPQEQQAQEQQMMSAAEKCMQAMQQGDQEGMKQALQQMVQEAMQQQAPAQEQAPMQAQASTKKKAQDDQGQQAAPAQEQKEAAPQAPVAQAPVAQQQMDLQAMIQSAVQNALMAQQQQQAPAEEPQAMANDDQMLLDEMLAPGAGPGDMAASSVGDIELEPAPMDVGEIGLGPEDDALRQLFANEEVEQAQQAQDKQAAVVRTASTRTVGTKPTAGVSRVGGLGGQSKTAGTQDDVNKLSSLWSSAPDVKEHFGIK